MDSTRTTRYDAYKAVRGLVEALRNIKLFDAEAIEARTTFDTLMRGLAAKRWQDLGPTTAEFQRKRLVEGFAECAPLQTVPASA
jgi:hypothetical protein